MKVNEVNNPIAIKPRCNKKYSGQFNLFAL